MTLILAVGSLTLTSCNNEPGASSPEKACNGALEAMEEGHWERYSSFLAEDRKGKMIFKLIGFASLSSAFNTEKSRVFEDILKSHDVIDPDNPGDAEKPKTFDEAAALVVSKVDDPDALLADLITFIYKNNEASEIESWSGFTMPRKGGELSEVLTNEDKASALVKHAEGGNQRIILRKIEERWFIEFFESAA